MDRATTAAAPPRSPQKDEAPGVGSGRFEGGKESGQKDCERIADAGVYLDAKRQAEKDDATLIATAALAGIELVKLADGSWLAQRWSMFRPLPAGEVRAWLAQVTGKAA